MNILLFGSDSSAHVLAWKLVNSAHVHEVILAPGNGGTNFFAPAIPLDPQEAGGIASFVLSEKIDLVVADISAISLGLPDALRALPLPVVGSSQPFIALHQSRCQLREWLLQHELPLPRGQVCMTQSQAEKVAATLNLPVRIACDSRDGLAVACTDRASIPQAISDCLAVSPAVGIIVEELVHGPVVTASVLTDGAHGVTIPATRLVFSAESGNTMPWLDANSAAGVYSAVTPLWTKLEGVLDAQVRQPLLGALQQDPQGGRGWISTTCVLGSRGPLVQAMSLVPSGMELAATLPRLSTDLLPLLIGCARGTLDAAPVPVWRPDAVVGVALLRASSTTSNPDIPASAFDSFEPGVLVFHHATTPIIPNTYLPRTGPYSAGRSSKLSFGGANLPFIATPSRGANPLVALAVSSAPTMTAAREIVYANLSRHPQAGISFNPDIAIREL